MEYPYTHVNTLSPSDFFNAVELPPTPVVQPGPRNYKSRKYRPCDFCRARQVACKIDVSPPCQLCTNHGRECTFVERPKKKRRPNASRNGSISDLQNGHSLRPIDPALTLDHQLHHQLHHQQQQQQQHHPLTDPSFVPQYDERLFDRSLASEHYLNPQASFSQSPLQQHPILQQDASPDYSNPSPILPMGPQERPLDSHSKRSARFVGETGESNPYLLRHYHYNDNDECTVSKLTYRRIKRLSQAVDQQSGKGEPPVVFMLADDSFAQKGEPRIEDDVLAKSRHEVSSMFTEEEALRLVALYFRFVNPYFPILAMSEMLANGNVSIDALRALPLSLAASLYATALPFILYDDLLATSLVHSPPSPQQLYRISWLAVVQELHTPRLATLQACLFLLQRAPTNRFTTDTPWKTSLVGWTVSLAQTLGLTNECSDWVGIPSWEMCLRKRLWHGVYIMDKWASLGAGMPSHIRKEDYDVLQLLPSDCEPIAHDQDSSQMAFPGPTEADGHFRLLSDLTLILSDIVDSYYSLRATKRTSKDLTLSLDLAKPLRTRLRAWNDSLPPALSLRGSGYLDSRGLAKLSGNASLSLAYIVANMTIFRALLRPLENLSTVEEADHGIVGSRRAVRTGARECAKEVVDFVEQLPRVHLDAFWHSWSRSNFAIASSFLMQLLLTAESSAESVEITDLVSRWRAAMRMGSGATGSGLMSLGLLRLDGLLRENGQSDERRLGSMSTGGISG
ncbi:MAG: hypothetical protein M1818_003945 [Claussenomyces sp. TS43310]|nr:MAG: hypothetical protein M1818_003945 [Claussenomyces sp. TS43310]